MAIAESGIIIRNDTRVNKPIDQTDKLIINLQVKSKIYKTGLHTSFLLGKIMLVAYQAKIIGNQIYWIDTPPDVSDVEVLILPKQPQKGSE